MKIFKTILLLAITIFLSSCYSTQDDLWLEHDGSGRLETTIDLSNFYSILKMGADKELKKMERDSTKKNEGNEFEDVMKKMLAKAEVDTILNIRNIVEQALRKEGKTMEDLWAKIDEELKEKNDISLSNSERTALDDLIEQLLNMKIHIETSKKESMLKFTFIRDFVHLDELSTTGDKIIELLNLLSRVTPKKEGKKPKITLEQITSIKELYRNTPKKYALDGKYLRIRRNGVDLDSFGKGEEKKSFDVLPMLKMFLGNQTHRLYVHFPNKVKKIYSERARKVDRNTILIETPMLDLYNGNKNLDVKIKFKRKRRYN